MAHLRPEVKYAFISIISSLALVVFAKLSPAGVAFANAGPHGGYSALTDACAGCHRAHTSPGSPLILRSNHYQLCLTCHGSGSSGSSLDVIDGKYLPTNERLNGGGFEFILSDAVTSRHDISGMAGYSPQYAWGGGSSGPGLGNSNTTPLECTSCHDPHGSSNYRILKEDESWADGQFPVRAVTTTESVPNYAAGTSGSYSAGITRWCSTCHTQYTHRGGVYDAGDGKGSIDRYRHSVSGFIPDGSTLLPMRTGVNNNFSCLTCHYAHGTTVSVGSYSTSIAPSGDSALLYIPGRGVCVSCHSPTGVGNIDVRSCLKCHSSSGTPAVPGGAAPPDIASRVESTYGHPVACTSCHASMPNHLDGEVQHYADGGFTLTKSLPVPITGAYQYSSDKFELCLSCHDEKNVIGLGNGFNQYLPGDNPPGYPPTLLKVATRFINLSPMGNYRNPNAAVPPPVNIHWDHLEDYNKWHTATDSRYQPWFPNSASGTVRSRTSCIACHDPHGSSRPGMTRDALAITNAEDATGHYRYIGSNAYRAYFRGFDFTTIYKSAAGSDTYCFACHWSGNGIDSANYDGCLTCHSSDPRTDQGTRWYYKLK